MEVNFLVEKNTFLCHIKNGIFTSQIGKEEQYSRMCKEISAALES